MELFAVQQCSREIPSVMVVRIPSGFKTLEFSTLQLTPKNSNSQNSLSLSLKKLKMLKFITALLFAQVLLAAPALRKRRPEPPSIYLNGSDVQNAEHTDNTQHYEYPEYPAGTSCYAATKPCKKD